jgi:hypothetical protein
MLLTAITRITPDRARGGTAFGIPLVVIPRCSWHGGADLARPL